MKALVIVESPSKVKSIQKYLGKEYVVDSSKGHIRDLPKSSLAVDVDKNYSLEYEITNKKKVSELKKAFKPFDKLILAVDPDREGEAIGWHVAQAIGVLSKTGKVKKGKELERITFTSITKDAVLEALESPREIDMDMVNAQQARRALDRLVGYKLSPLLWKKIRFGLSAGRVQSVAVKMIVEREEEREAFVPDEFWNILLDWESAKQGKQDIVLNKANIEEAKNDDGTTKKESNEGKFRFVGKGGKKVSLVNEADVQKIIDAIKGKALEIQSIESKPRAKKTMAPFITSTLQREASNKFGYSAKKTMMVAQKLYEGGHITYMRTDSFNLSKDALGSIRGLIKSDYGAKYLPEKAKFYGKATASSQEAHEAIRPTNIKENGEGIKKLTDEQYNVYNLIWRRTIASQMTDAVLNRENVKADIEDYNFDLSGQTIKFDGFLKVYKSAVKNTGVPKHLKVGDSLAVNKIIGNQQFTSPPARYSESSLIKALELHGIGRPSTYVPIVTTIQTRKYVEKVGKVFIPTDTGRVVTNLLRDNFSDIVDYDFTAEMEKGLDKVAEGDIDWTKLLDNFYKPFISEVTKKDKEIDRDTYTVLGEAPADMKCPKCNAKMNIKLSKFGKFYSCSKWPDCAGMRDLEGRTDEQINEIRHSDNFKKVYKDSPRTKDDREYALKRGRFGFFWAHPDYPKKKDAKPLEFTDKVMKEVYGENPVAKDGKKMKLRKGRFGEFWAHPDYPEVKEVSRVNKKEIAQKKEEVFEKYNMKL